MFLAVLNIPRLEHPIIVLSATPESDVLHVGHEYAWPRAQEVKLGLGSGSYRLLVLQFEALTSLYGLHVLQREAATRGH